jgi:hypothetical protein
MSHVGGWGTATAGAEGLPRHYRSEEVFCEALAVKIRDDVAEALTTDASALRVEFTQKAPRLSATRSQTRTFGVPAIDEGSEPPREPHSRSRRSAGCSSSDGSSCDASVR